MKRWQATIFLLVTCGNSIAQDYTQKDVNLEVLADELFGLQDQDLNYQELYETMAQLLANKVNLNTANAEDLRFLNLLSEYQVQSLLEYRNENGPLISVYELQSVPGFDPSIISKIIPFVKAEVPGSGKFLRKILTEENNYFIIRYDRTLETKNGFKENTDPANRFTGDEGDVYIRFRTSKSGSFSTGFTLEKDAGEKITWASSAKRYGFDFTSFHFQLINKKRLKNLIIGDYQAQFGQGLLLGGGFGYGKGSEAVMTVRRSNLGFLPYTSANETGFKRGAAITYEVARHIYVSGFYSNAWRDGSITGDTTGNSLSSFQTTGYHRNGNELAGRSTVQEQNYGVVLNFKRNAWDAGIIFNEIDFNIPINRKPQPYNQFTFEGRTQKNTGAFLNYTFQNFTLFSEAAHTWDNGFGITAGILGSITPRLDLAIHYRNYQRNFYSLYSNAFSENSTPQNESGIYWGWKYRWNRTLSISGYVDLFKFPWLRFRSYIPSEGHEWLIRFNYQPSKNTVIFLQAREESKVRNSSGDESNLYLTHTGIKRNYSVNFDYPGSRKIKMKTRIQFSTYAFNGMHTKGMTILQDINIDLGKLNLTGRYALFDTDDFDNRQYAYERDVWLAYTLPAYFGKGIRNFLLIEYSISKKLSLWFRYAHTRYIDREEIGSGADTITGNVKNDLRIQARVKL